MIDKRKAQGDKEHAIFSQVASMKTAALAAVVFALALATTACNVATDEAQEAETASTPGAMLEGRPWTQTVFEGVTIPGTAAQAKEGGFTNCEVVEDTFGSKTILCRRSKAVFFGLPVDSAELTLDAAPNLRDGSIIVGGWPDSMRNTDGKKLEDLSFGSVRFAVNLESANECVRDKINAGTPGPQARKACESPSSAKSITEAMKAAGWVPLPIPQNSYAVPYARRDTPLVISSGLDMHSVESRITFEVEPIDPSEANEAIAKVEATKQAADQAAAADQALVDQMKGSASATP